jgi:5-hydroxyisourate hydrolase
MASTMSGISTHILDTSIGKPAAGVRVSLDSWTEGARWENVASGTTDANGRCGSILAAENVRPGRYRFSFDTAAHFAGRGQNTLYPEVTIIFLVAEGELNYHIPLLLNPFGYSTYRGS